MPSGGKLFLASSANISEGILGHTNRSLRSVTKLSSSEMSRMLDGRYFSNATHLYLDSKFTSKTVDRCWWCFCTRNVALTRINDFRLSSVGPR